MKRFWILAAVWVVFWSLYPTFDRPMAFRGAIRAGARELEACDPIPTNQERHACYQMARERMQQRLAAITLRRDYEGYAPVWFGVGVGVPAVGVMALMMLKRRSVAKI